MSASEAALRREMDYENEPRALNVWRGHSRVIGMGHFVPEQVCEIGELHNLSETLRPVMRQVTTLTGVERVRRTPESMSLVDLAVEAVHQVFANPDVKRRGISPRDVDALIFGSVSREYTEPATAAAIHARLGLEQAIAFDVSNACLGFVDGWCIADAMLQARQCRLALVVCAEKLYRYRQLALENILNGARVQDHFASLTLGDGAVACLFEPKPQVGGDRAVLAGARTTFGKHSDLCTISIDRGPMHSDPKALFSAALREYASVVQPVLDASGWRARDVDVVITHQASKRAIEQGCREIGIDPKRALLTVADYGNMASVSVPFTLSKALSEGSIKRGDKVLVAGLGSGIGIAALTVQC